MKHPCPECDGTGRDAEATARARRRGGCDGQSYIRCWACLGNGTDNWAIFQEISAMTKCPAKAVQNAAQ